MGGRGSIGGQAPTHARDIENMNEAQIKRELASAKRRYKAAKAVISASRGEDAPDTAQINQNAVQSRAARDASVKAYVNEQGKLAKAYQTEQEMKKRIIELNHAQRTVNGTGKTKAQVLKESKDSVAYASGTWTKTRVGNQVVHSNGEYTIKHNTGGFYRLYRADGTHVSDGRTMNEAKAYATLDRDRRRRR